MSEAPYDSLNVAVLTGDTTGGRAREPPPPRRRRSAWIPRSVLIGRQVHGAEIARHDAAQRPSAFADPGPELPEVDGQITTATGLAPLVMVADCLPVAMAGEKGVAMLHCGWRGLAAGILARGAAEIEATAAAVGPGIGPCHFEVGEEVLDAFAPLGEGIADGRMLDLREVARRLLERAGVGRGRGQRAVHELRDRALLLPPPRRRRHGAPGRPRLDRGLTWRS